MYYPLYRGGKPYVYMAVHSGPGSIKPRAAHSADDFQDRSRLPLSDVMTMDQLIGKQTLEQRLNATLL